MYGVKLYLPHPVVCQHHKLVPEKLVDMDREHIVKYQAVVHVVCRIHLDLVIAPSMHQPADQHL